MIIQGDALTELRNIPDESVHCCVTSPPYWGLRDYGVDVQMGLETTPEAYVARMTEVFREVRRVLRRDGTLWLNLGDSYAQSEIRNRNGKSQEFYRPCREGVAQTGRKQSHGLKPKDLVGIPWRVAFALQSDGWYLRQDIIWHKPNPMPESVRDRCTKAHEYLFLMTKSERYWWDAEAMRERAKASDIGSMDGGAQKRIDGSNANEGRNFRQSKSGNKSRKPAIERGCPRNGTASGVPWEGFFRNRRSVWTVPTRPYRGAHFATYPPNLIRPCILAGCPPSGIVLDPFAGSGTTGQVAVEEGRDFILIELNPDFIALIRKRMKTTQPGLQLEA